MGSRSGAGSLDCATSLNTGTTHWSQRPSVCRRAWLEIRAEILIPGRVISGLDKAGKNTDMWPYWLPVAESHMSYVQQTLSLLIEISYPYLSPGSQHALLPSTCAVSLRLGLPSVPCYILHTELSECSAPPQNPALELSAWFCFPKRLGHLLWFPASSTAAPIPVDRKHLPRDDE